MGNLFPTEFSDLERLGDWALATEEERSAKRQASTFEELQTVYNTVLPRMDEALAYLDALPLDALPADAERLLWLTLSLAEVAPAIEQFGQVTVVDGFESTRVVPFRRD